MRDKRLSNIHSRKICISQIVKVTVVIQIFFNMTLINYISNYRASNTTSRFRDKI